MTSVTVRFASSNEGVLLHNLAQASGKWEITEMDWTFDPYPYWLVAEIDSVPVGCVQAIPGVPFGHIEYLCVAPTLSPKAKAIVARDLCERARENCRKVGAQFVSFTLQPYSEDWERVLENRGAGVWFEGGTTMIMRA